MKKSIRLIALVTLSSLVLMLSACSTGTTDSGDSGDDGSSGTDSGSSGDAISAGTATEVVTAANAFLALLDDTQKASVVLTASADTATAWSNLPCGSTCRNGIEFSTLSDEQLTAAQAVVQAALGTVDEEGYDEVTQILAADDVLGAAGGTAAAGGNVTRQPGGGGGGGYSSGTYFLAFLGTPAPQTPGSSSSGGITWLSTSTTTRVA